MSATREQELKIELYDVIERQAILAQENQRLENIKVEKVKALNELRQAAAAAQPQAEAPRRAKKEPFETVAA